VIGSVNNICYVALCSEILVLISITGVQHKLGKTNMYSFEPVINGCMWKRIAVT
jgi:hypothetical protein